MNNGERAWLTNASKFGGYFIKSFAATCLYADEDNFKILKPAFDILMDKYPKYFNVLEAMSKINE